ncbi:MAG: 2-C-methyl-D-erythritol 2,4-cyclodiphosphate synthase [bacterium ADurb.Bin363]|nr:MAG: 2-C-methyl-D-erythritol 2,4-cyclodiphosphate synthase [bacterium ADurb.Bin363]
MGFDVHKLVSGRDLILGGINIPFELGLDGHSDADVLIHAIMDALLGAIGEYDIGRQFPDSDLQYKGISSLLLLGKVYNKVKEKGYTVNNLDSIIVAEKPKIAPFIDKMKGKLGSSLHLDINNISIKATTSEGLGFVGRGEGIAAYAIVSVKVD